MTRTLALTVGIILSGCQQAGDGQGASPSPSESPSPSPSPSPTIDEAALADQAACEELLGPFLEALEDLDARLDVGLVFQDYTNRVGDVSVEYNQVRFGALPAECTTEVGVPLENALNAYIKANNRWNDCIGDFGCSLDSIEAQLQRQWRKAAQEIRKARQALRDLA